MTILRNRIGYIDGLRAIAVLTVVASHAVSKTTMGQFGVELFFVISGFCLSYPTLAKLNQKGSADFGVYRYAARRVVRIIPPYWIAIAVLFAAAFVIPGLHRASGRDVMAQAFFLDRGTDFLAGSFWTLPIEFRWYFLFPIALLLWVRNRKIFFLAAFAALIVVQATVAGSYDLLELPAFMSGIVAADICIRGHRLSKFALPACAILVIAVWSVARSFASPIWNATAFIPVLEAIMFLLVVGAGSSLWVTRALSMKWLTVVGLASYSIYLIHGPVIALAQSRGANPWIAASLGIGAGFIFWFVAERPFVDTKLRDRLVSEFEDVFSRWFPRVGIGKAIGLTAALQELQPAVETRRESLPRAIPPLREDAASAKP